jgi:small subunit ribosomal protein S20
LSSLEVEPLPNKKQQEKRMRQDERRRMRNRSRKTEIKTFTKKFEATLSQADQDASKAALVAVVSLLDRAATDKIVHKNNAARHKSRLTAKYQAAFTAK